jgi:fructokinase
MTVVFGGIELGGTHAKAAIGDGRAVLADEQVTVVSTTSPETTLSELLQVFRGVEIAALGVASFGPLDLRSGSTGATPKHDWQGVALRDTLGAALGVEVAIDTDVNGAVWAERALGAAEGCEDALYLTVGTGIGAGAVVNGSLVHGLGHPEMGHLRVPRLDGDGWPGSCPFHGDCWEGIASGAALLARYGVRAEELDDECAWTLEARYLALGIANLIFSYRPARVVVGGGVLVHAGLLDAVRNETARLVDPRYFGEVGQIDGLVVPAKLAHAGLQGALLFARQACER